MLPEAPEWASHVAMIGAQQQCVLDVLQEKHIVQVQ